MTTTGRAVLLGGAGFLLVVVAVVLEALAIGAGAQVPTWARWLPIAWPRPARIGWWASVAMGALYFRRALPHLGVRASTVGTMVTVGPFAAFAVGVALEAPWATWH